MESPGIARDRLEARTGVRWLALVEEDEQDLDDGLEEVDGEDVYRLGSFVISSGTFFGELRQHYARQRECS